LSLVIDSSAALAWCFEDEQTSAILNFLDEVVENGAVAPALWPLEVLNALLTAERRKRLDAAQRQRLAGFLRDLPITIDSETDSQAWTATMRLAEAHGLTVYDAAYLELAQRLALPLAALDRALRAAAKAEGVPLIEFGK
jgi:predicted nucleic acid-binding protein